MCQVWSKAEYLPAIYNTSTSMYIESSIESSIGNDFKYKRKTTAFDCTLWNQFWSIVLVMGRNPGRYPPARPPD